MRVCIVLEPHPEEGRRPVSKDADLPYCFFFFAADFGGTTGSIT